MNRRTQIIRSALGLASAMFAAAAACAATAQFEVVGKDGQALTDAIVIVEAVSGAKPPVPPAQTLLIDQRKKQFVPTVTLAPLGSKLLFTNQDNYDHHVVGRPGGIAAFTANAPAVFELRLSARSDGKSTDRAEVLADKLGVLDLNCNIHGSMRGFVYVTDSAWTARTDEQGRATLTDLPEGAVRVRVWHPEQIVESPPLTAQLASVSVVKVPTQVTPRRRQR
jgi:plastocyanin